MILAAWLLINSVGLLVGAVHLRNWSRRAMSYVRRDEAGHIYITDPQTGATHRLEELLRQRIGVAKDAEASPRQRRRARGRLRHA